MPGGSLGGRDDCHAVIIHHPVTKVDKIVVGWKICFQESSSISGWFFSSFCSLWERWLECLSFKLVTTCFVVQMPSSVNSCTLTSLSLRHCLYVVLLDFMRRDNFVGRNWAVNHVVVAVFLWETSSLPSYVVLKQRAHTFHYCSLSTKKSVCNFS